MKNISVALFNELKSDSAVIDVGWLVIRTDGERFAFTTADISFVYGDDTYSPTNGMNPSAIVAKGNMSVDNMEMQCLESDSITDQDLRSGLWDNAVVQVFWINPNHPEWGILPLRGGRLGQIVTKNNTWNTQLRSLFEQLQQPFGYFFSVQCQAQLGDPRCKVNLDPPTWAANTTYQEGLQTDAGKGSIVKPTSDNGFWYVANYTTYGGSGYGGQDTRAPTVPGQGLSGNDDLGPNDDTQVAVGAAWSDLSEYVYQPNNVDIFGIKI